MASREVQVRLDVDTSAYEEAIDGMRGLAYFALAWPTRCPIEVTG